MGGATGSRHDPARLTPLTLLRGRLVGPLRGRFERRLTVIEAGAGFGKSTLLAQAMHEARLDGFGADALVRLTEADQDPSHLRDGLGGALGLTERGVSLDRVIDAVWARAPTAVAIIVDDVHRLGDEGPAWVVLRDLLDRMPSNGHLVVSGRQPPQLPVARLRSQDDAITVDESTLAFDDDELAAIVELRAIPPTLAAELPRWPALATLTGAVGRHASIEYLWDEVLRTMPDDRRALLAAAAPFGEIDDALVGALRDALGGGYTAAELVADMPLIDTVDGGAYRLHDLWIDALTSSIDPPTRTIALRAGGTMLLARNDLLRAGEAFALAADDAGLDAVLIAFARRPTLAADINEIDRLHRLLPDSMRDRAGARYLDAARHYATDDRRAADAFAQVAEVAMASGEVEMEVLARWRLVQFDDLDDPAGTPLSPRVRALAEAGIPMARAVRGFVRSRIAQHLGDPHGSIAELGALDDFDPAQRDISVAIRMMDLGRPEALDATLDEVLGGGINDLFAAQAVWQMGAIDPVDAWPFARLLPERGDSVPLMTRIGLSSVVTLMGAMAGAHDEIASLSAVNLRNARSSARMVTLFAQVADAMVQLVTVDEETAVSTLADLLEEIPLDHWPKRPYLYALAMIRGLLPGGHVLDDCDFGPSITVAVEAGAALAALRAGDVGPATRLPWDRSTLLRVHVPPPLLAELALAVTGAGHTTSGPTPAATAVLDALPHRRTWMRRLIDRNPDSVATTVAGRAIVTRLAKDAATLAAALPSRPDHDLHIGVMGRMTITRSDGIAVGDWDRRERVRHLLAFVALRRDVSRREAAAELWPDLPPDKAAANLRVNLHHLQRALQPDRDPADPPWFVQSDGGRLWLADEGVEVDCHVIDTHMVDAVRAEAAGLPSVALGHYEAVAAIAADDLLPAIAAEWVVYERMRLRSVIHAAACRQGELVLARGEPEAAMRIAARAQRLDPISERAHRLSIRCHLAVGSATAARHGADHLRATMADAGLPLEAESETLLARLGR